MGSEIEKMGWALPVVVRSRLTGLNHTLQLRDRDELEGNIYWLFKLLFKFSITLTKEESKYFEMAENSWIVYILMAACILSFSLLGVTQYWNLSLLQVFGYSHCSCDSKIEYCVGLQCQKKLDDIMKCNYSTQCLSNNCYSLGVEERRCKPFAGFPVDVACLRNSDCELGLFCSERHKVCKRKKERLEECENNLECLTSDCSKSIGKGKYCRELKNMDDFPCSIDQQCHSKDHFCDDSGLCRKKRVCIRNEDCSSSELCDDKRCHSRTCDDDFGCPGYYHLIKQEYYCRGGMCVENECDEQVDCDFKSGLMCNKKSKCVKNTCKVDRHCSDELMCVEKKCISRECDNHPDCRQRRENTMCMNGMCKSTSCKDSIDCPSDMYCSSGYIRGSCLPLLEELEECVEDEECKEGKCRKFHQDGSYGLCFQESKRLPSGYPCEVRSNICEEEFECIDGRCSLPGHLSVYIAWNERFDRLIQSEMIIKWELEDVMERLIRNNTNNGNLGQVNFIDFYGREGDFESETVVLFVVNSARYSVELRTSDIVTVIREVEDAGKELMIVFFTTDSQRGKCDVKYSDEKEFKSLMPEIKQKYPNLRISEGGIMELAVNVLDRYDFNEKCKEKNLKYTRVKNFGKRVAENEGVSLDVVGKNSLAVHSVCEESDQCMVDLSCMYNLIIQAKWCIQVE